MVDSKYEDIPEVLKKYYPGGIFGFDLDGRPVYYEPIGRVDFVGLLHSASKEDILRYRKLQCEKLREICKQQEISCQKDLENISTLVLDAKGGGRKHLWKPGLESYQEILQMYETDFPNIRQQILVINAPAIFPIITTILRPFSSSSTYNKMTVLGRNWKSELQKYIHKDQLPEYYGGTAKDEQGDPKCSKYICYGGEVPKSYYKNKLTKPEEFQSVVVKAGESFKKEIEVTQQGARILYQFVTKDYNITFSVKCKSILTGEFNEMIGERKYDSHLIMQEGNIDCDVIGTYYFVFDNSHSWIRDKELFYLINAIEYHTSSETL